MERMKLRGMSQFKKERKSGGAEDDENGGLEEDENSNLSEANEKTFVNLSSRLSPLDTENDNMNDDNQPPQSPSQIVHFFSQPSELPSSAKVESCGPLSSSQPVSTSADNEFPVLRSPSSSSHHLRGFPSRSLGSLSQFLREQVGSFGLNSTQGTNSQLSSSAVSGGNLGSAVLDGRLRSGGVLKVQKYTFRHSFSLKKD